MKKDILLCLLVLLLPAFITAQTPYFDKTRNGFLVFHPIKTDSAGKIVSWYGEEPGQSFDFVIRMVWNFWDTMRMENYSLRW